MSKVLGANIVINAKEEDPIERALEITSGKVADIRYRGRVCGATLRDSGYAGTV